MRKKLSVVLGTAGLASKIRAAYKPQVVGLSLVFTGTVLTLGFLGVGLLLFGSNWTVSEMLESGGALFWPAIISMIVIGLVMFLAPQRPAGPN